MTLRTNMNISVTDCYYADTEHNTIVGFVEFPGIEKTPILLTADTPGTASELFENAINGEYGPITSYADSHWYCTLHGYYWNDQYYCLGDAMISPSGEQPPNSTNQPNPYSTPLA
jgi:hypothetical protein